METEELLLEMYYDTWAEDIDEEIDSSKHIPSMSSSGTMTSSSGGSTSGTASSEKEEIQ